MISRDQNRGRALASAAMLLLLSSATAMAGTTGNLTGYVNGPDGKALPGVKVTVTAPVLQGSRMATTDAQGFFRMTQLPPGDGYKARFDASGFTPTERTGVRINIDATIKLPTVVMKPVQAIEAIEVIEDRPVVEQGSTTIGKNLSNEFLSAVPTGRSSTAVLALAPGASSDSLGVTFRGATSPENSYIIDGLNTTGIQYGLASSNLPPEFIQEIQVKTGGYEPEYGRATGGQAIVITKSGGNEFHGDVFLYATPLYAGVLPTIAGQDNIYNRDTEEASFISVDQPNLFLQAGFDIGGYLIKDRLWFFAGYAPTLSTRTRTWDYQQLCGGYKSAGTAKQTSDGSIVLATDPAFASTVGTPITACYNADGSLTKAPGPTDVSLPEGALNEDRTTISHYYLANLTYNINQDHSIRLSASGSPTSNEGYIAAPAGDPGTFMGTQASNTMDVSLTYNGKFAGGLVNLDAILGYHTESDSTTPFVGTYDNSDSNTQNPWEGQTFNGYAPFVAIQRYGYRTSRENPNDGILHDNAVPTGYEEKCKIMDSTTGELVDGPCVFYGYGEGGFGGLDKTSASRLVFKPILSIFLNNMVGNHVIKVGGDLEQNSMQNYRTFTGGTLVLHRTSYSRERYYSLNSRPLVWSGAVDGDFSMSGTDDAKINWFITDTRTENYSAFVQDNWSLLSNLSLNLGVRWEVQTIKDVNNIARITIPDNVAPRLGLIFDFTNQGKSKLFANFGRYYESIPHDINDRALSAEGFRFYQFGSSGPIALTDLDGDGLKDYFPGQQDVDWKDLDGDGVLDETYEPGAVSASSKSFELGGEQAYIQKGLKGQYKDSFIVGFEYEVAQDLSLGVTGIYDTLGRVIEDISPDNGNTYIIANPDADNYSYLIVEDPLTDSVEQGLDGEAPAADGSNLARQCIASFDPLSGAPTTYCFPKATRTYTAFEISMSKRFSSGWQGLASYTASQVYGNYPGLFAQTNGQLDPNITSQFDLPNLLVNRDGPLDGDRTHALKFSGAYSFKFGTSLGLTANIQSGLPVLYLGGHPAYGGNEAFLLPRGVTPTDVGDQYISKTPWLFDIDVNARHTLTFANKQRLALGVQVSNLLNTQDSVRVNQTYTTDYASPYPGASSINETQCYGVNTFTANVTCTPFPNYQQATAFQSPLSVRIEAKYSF